jgi:peptide/nickel transport system substrate-binding protein
VEDLYRASDDKAAFVNSSYFRSQFVGLGPYRLDRWEEGSHLELSRFDDYYQGRPAFNSILVRFITDANTMVANVLAGTVDVVLPPAVGLDVALEVQRRWEGTGNQVLAGASGALAALDPQVRPEYAQPRNGFPNSLIRQAFYHAIDRPTLTEVLTRGLAAVADSHFPSDHPLRPEMEGWIPQFPYDLARAGQLLAQAGWSRGADGTLMHGASGERFQTELRSDPEGSKERLVNVIADGWKAIGAETSLNLVASAIAGDRELRAKRSGFNVITASGSAYYDRNRLHSGQIASEANRWTGINTGGYSNPRVDALLDQLRTTINPRERVSIHQQLVREQTGDLGVLPLYWDVNTVLMVKGVRGPKIVKGEATQNIIQWDREI